MKFTRFLLPILPLAAAVGMAQTVPPTPFLKPSSFAVRTGQAISLAYVTVTDATPAAAPWPSNVGWLFTRASGTQENRHDVRPARAQDSAIPIEIREAGVTVIGADRTTTVAEVSGAGLREFLNRHVAADAVRTLGELPAAGAAVKVRLVESAKTLVRAAGPDAGGQDARGPVGSGVAASKTGQAVEIQPATDPTVLRVGSDLPLRLLIAGDKKSGAKLVATSPSGKIVSFDSDPAGGGHIRISEAGAWRLEFHHVARLEDDPAAEWVLYTATLMFEVPLEETPKAVLPKTTGNRAQKGAGK
ncbi:MAG: DUF4198 domain-containing protein [Planctomycetota bacterium]